MSDSKRIIYPGQIYKHFKGNLYQIITIALHSETSEKLVIYQKLYGDFKVHARPYDMFLSEVDHNKYPDVKQTYRFELINDVTSINKEEITNTDNIVLVNDKEVIENEIEFHKEIENNSDNEEADSRLLEFLDADTFEEKRRVLISIKSEMTDRLIDDMAAAIDVTVDEGDIDTRFLSLLTCINTRGKYEVNRLR